MLKIWEKMKEIKEIERDGRERKWKGKEKEDLYIKMENIHFNPSGKLTLKSNSFLAIWSKIAT